MKNENYHEICLYYLVDITKTNLLLRGDKFTLYEGQRTNRFEWLAFHRLKDEYLYPLFIKKEIYHLPKHLTIITEFE